MIIVYVHFGVDWIEAIHDKENDTVYINLDYKSNETG